MRASALCAAFFTSNQIPFAACAGVLSPQYVFRAAQTCHNEDSGMAFARGAKSDPSVKSFAFLILPVTAESGLIETPSYLIVCFAPTSAFPEKQATTPV